MSLENLSTKVIDIAIEAGEIILKQYKKSSIDFELKSDNSPLTKADIQSHRFISQNLICLNNLAVCSEEDPLAYEERKNLESYWIVDPLDGTKDFLAKNNQFTINIALLQNNIPALGVVYAPALGQLYYAYNNGGAFYLQISQKSDKQDVINLNNQPLVFPQVPTAGVSNFHDTQETQDFINRYNLHTKKIGSALKFCALATREIDLYPRFNGTKEWDSAAGDIIVTQSGGIIIDTITKQPLAYNKPNIKNNHFVAFGKTQINTKIYHDLLKIDML